MRNGNKNDKIQCEYIGIRFRTGYLKWKVKNWEIETKNGIENNLIGILNLLERRKIIEEENYIFVLFLFCSLAQPLTKQIWLCNKIECSSLHKFCFYFSHNFHDLKMKIKKKREINCVFLLSFFLMSLKL